jgi:hypothetical protein
MIFGDYPCCNAPLAIAMPERPGFFRELCPACGTAVWHKMSRLDPQSWTEVDFLKEYRVDEVTNQVTELTPAPELSETQQLVLEEEIINRLLYGDPSSPEPVGILAVVSK